MVILLYPLKSCIYDLNPANKEDTFSKKENITGKEVYKNTECGACHIFQGEGSSMGQELINLSENYNKEELKAFLKNHPKDMPSF